MPLIELYYGVASSASLIIFISRHMKIGLYKRIFCFVVISICVIVSQSLNYWAWFLIWAILVLCFFDKEHITKVCLYSLDACFNYTFITSAAGAVIVLIKPDFFGVTLIIFYWALRFFAFPFYGADSYFAISPNREIRKSFYSIRSYKQA